MKKMYMLAEIGGVCSVHGRDKIAYRILVGKPEEKRLLRRSRCRCENNA
jgi:hypothetical protein